MYTHITGDGPADPPSLPPTALEVRDRVAVACVGCLMQECSFQEALGVGCCGGYADHAVAPLKNLVRSPDAVSLADAAVATDYVATAYHTIMAEGRVSDATTVAVVGLCGLSLNGVALAAPRGARVFGVDIKTDKFE